MLTHVCEQFTHGSLWMQAKRSSRDFRMSSLLLETGPTVILDEKSHTNLRHFTRMCIPSLPNGFLEVHRERASSHQSKSRVPWLTNPPEQAYWQCILLCCAVLRCVVLCSVVLCCAPLCCAKLLCCARCCVVLCCVVLCSIVLYSVVLCSNVLSRKKFISDLHMNIEGHFWGLPVASPMTWSQWKYFFLHNLGRSFHIWWQIEAALSGLDFPKWLPDWCLNNSWTRKISNYVW